MPLGMALGGLLEEVLGGMALGFLAPLGGMLEAAALFGESCMWIGGEP